MLTLIKKAATRLGRSLGIGSDWTRLFPADPRLEPALAEIVERIRPFTMTSRQRIQGFCKSMAYIEERGIPGDIVECGVWKGGSMMAAALSLVRLGSQRRTLHLFDTFAGMPAPTAVDQDKHGQRAADLVSDTAWAQHVVCSREQVQANLLSTGYDPARLRFIEGKVEDTIPAHAPATIAVLRLDTDWYESTYHELVHLFPRLSSGGVLILDDYGHWQGARKAVDQYFAERALPFHLHSLGGSARILLKSQARVAA